MLLHAMIVCSDINHLRIDCILEEAKFLKTICNKCCSQEEKWNWHVIQAISFFSILCGIRYEFLKLKHSGY